MARTLTRDRAQALLDAAEVAWWLWGDLGLSVRRVLAAGRNVSENTLTSQTVYTYFGSMDAMIAAMAERAVSALQLLTEEPVDAGRWREYARQFPARWVMAATGRTPHDVPAPALGAVIDGLRHGLGGPGEFAMVNGVIAAELHGQLTAEAATTALHRAVVGSVSATP